MIDLLPYFVDEMVTATLVPGATGSYVNGEWVAAFGSSESIQIIYPQPLTQNELNQLPQGERVRNFIQTWTSSTVNVRADTVDGDHITYDGKEYLVYQMDDRVFFGNFRHLILREITSDE